MPIPVIIDTDPGVDDIIAILFALASPELEILAFFVSFGNTDLESSYVNILKVYQILEEHLAKFPEQQSRFPNFQKGRKPILARGPTDPLQGEIHSAQYFHGRDGLGDIHTRHPELDLKPASPDHPYLQQSTLSAAEVGLNILRDRPPRSVVYVALGPLTNLARMMHRDSQLVTERIGRIVSMGGALDVPGNTGPVSEFNYFADPFAVRELLISSDLHPGLPLDLFLMLPLDITTPHELPFPVYKAAVDSSFEGSATPSLADKKGPLTHFTSSFLEKTRDIMLLFGKDAMELHDIVAVWCATAHPPSIEDAPALAPQWTATRRVFDIERMGELTRGMLVVDRREDEAAFPIGATRSEAQRDEADLIPVSKGQSDKGIWCVDGTPGPAVLLSLLLERVWGVKHEDVNMATE